MNNLNDNIFNEESGKRLVVGRVAFDVYFRVLILYKTLKFIKTRSRDEYETYLFEY